MRIGLTSDMHAMEPDGSDLAEGLLTAFADVDLIVACGDHVTGAALDRLAQLAPLVATINPNAENDGEGRAVNAIEVVKAESRSFGVMFSPRPLGADVTEGGAIKWPVDLAERARAVFGQDVDGVLFGSTHSPSITEIDGLVLINPGSPRFAERTTAAIVEVDEATGEISPAIIDV